MKGEKIHILVRKHSCQLRHATGALDSPERKLVDKTEVMFTEVLSAPFALLSKANSVKQ